MFYRKKNNGPTALPVAIPLDASHGGGGRLSLVYDDLCHILMSRVVI